MKFAWSNFSNFLTSSYTYINFKTGCSLKSNECQNSCVILLITPPSHVHLLFNYGNELIYMNNRFSDPLYIMEANKRPWLLTSLIIFVIISLKITVVFIQTYFFAIVVYSAVFWNCGGVYNYSEPQSSLSHI